MDQTARCRSSAWAPSLALSSLYLDCREGDVRAFWLVIFLGQVVGAADSFDALSSGGGHMSVSTGFVLLDTDYRTFSCDMNTIHGLYQLHRCFPAVRATFADVDHVVVADDAELTAAAGGGGV